MYACFLFAAGVLGLLTAVANWRYGYENENSFFIQSCIVAFAAAGVNSVLSNTLVSRTYLLLSFAPPLIVDFLRGGTAGYSLCGGTILLFFYLATQSRDLNREYVRGISDHWNLQLRTRELQLLAHHDALTGLPNRLFLRERVSQVMHDALGASRIALLFIDLDRFKQVNDTFSHRVGDLYLVTVGQRISLALQSGELLARVGGDEFLLMIENLTDIEFARGRAQDIMECLSTPVVVEGHEFPVSASVGISISPDHGTDLETLQKNADIAMYSAKHSGRGQFEVFMPHMSEKYGRATLIEKELRRAISGTGLCVHYQPQFDSSGRVIGLEALARFRAESLGPVSPAEFIPVAEETGLIRGLGRWVLHEACRQAIEWQNSGLEPVRIAVNVSAAQLIREDFVKEVSEVLIATGLQPHLLELELTESLFMKDLNDVAGTMNALRALGVRFSIDDFGAGYSSLSYLHRLPIDAVKIDRSFINDLGTDSANNAVIESILALARSLQLRVVAEGVETAAQYSILRRLECTEFQGYLFAKPVQASEIPTALREARVALVDASPEQRSSADLCHLAQKLGNVSLVKTI